MMSFLPLFVACTKILWLDCCPNEMCIRDRNTAADVYARSELAAPQRFTVMETDDGYAVWDLSLIHILGICNDVTDLPAVFLPVIP